MRIYQQGFEGFTHVTDGLARVTNEDYDSGPPRKDAFGNGGVRCMRSDDSTNNSFSMPQRSFQYYSGTTTEPKEFWLRFGSLLNLDETWKLRLRILNGLRELFFAFDHNIRGVTLYSDDFSTSVNSASFFTTHSIWLLCEMHIYLDSSSGFVDLYINGESSPSYSFSGNTTNGTAGGLGNFTFAGGRYIDDIVIDTPTMLYDTGTGGTPGIGNTVTGGTSGATAVIEGYDGDATSGRLFLSGVSGSFSDGETITDTGTFSADVNAPNATYVSGLEPNSTRPGDGYIIAVIPNADFSAALNGSDGNSVNNYQLVDERGANTTDYVYTDTTGTEDKYDCSAPGFSSTENGEISVSCVSVKNYCMRSGEGISNIQVSIQSGTTTQYSDNIELPTVFDVAYLFSEFNPDTGAAWTISEIDSIKIGQKFNS